jgi:hypothetical protein
MVANDRFGPFEYGGDVILTRYGGVFRLEEQATHLRLADHDQAVVPRGTRVAVVCEAPGTLQVIWAPSFAPMDGQ